MPSRRELPSRPVPCSSVSGAGARAPSHQTGMTDDEKAIAKLSALLVPATGWVGVLGDRLALAGRLPE